MPRKRRKKDKKPKKPENKSEPSPNAESKEFVKGYSVDAMKNFTKTSDDSYIVIYRVPSEHLGKEDTMSHYRSKMITALQDLGRKKGIVISVQHIKMGIMPDGDHSVIKAYAFKKDTPKGRMEITQKSKDASSGTNFDWSVENEAKSRFTK